jgi:hypothetical protein
MGVLIPAALPVLPGQSDRVRNFKTELAPHRDEWERLNRVATVTRYAVHLQETPMGDLAIHVMEADDPSRIRDQFTESSCDRWWLDYLRDVHGLDLRGVLPEEMPQAPPPVFTWPER